MEIFYTLNEIEDAARSFLSLTTGHQIFTFTGDLGSGKTTFINALCRQLGVGEKVTSPTYSLIHEYGIMNNRIIYHMDFYRINSLQEAIDAGAEDCISSGEICMIEWPDKIEKVLPEDVVKCDIIMINEDGRKLMIRLPQ